MSEATQAVLDRLRRLVDDQEGGDAVVLVQRQLFNRTVGRIEAQAKEIAELKAALREMIYETTSLSPMEDDGSHWCKISKDALTQARKVIG